MKITRDVLIKELDLPDSAIEDTITSHSRWSVYHTIIFSYRGKYYRTAYSVGATEMQDESPWEYEKEVDCKEVEKRSVLVEKWVEIDA